MSEVLFEVGPLPQSARPQRLGLRRGAQASSVCGSPLRAGAEACGHVDSCVTGGALFLIGKREL